MKFKLKPMSIVMLLLSLLTCLFSNTCIAVTSDGIEGAGKHITGEALDTDKIREDAPDLIEDPIDALVVKMKSSSVPIDQMTRSTKSVKVNGMRYNYYSVDTRAMLANVVAGSVLNANANGDSITLNVDKYSIFDDTDQIVLTGVAGWNSKTSEYSLLTPLSLYVRKAQEGKLVCQPINGQPKGEGYEVPAAAATVGNVVLRLGHCASEGDVTTVPYSALPSKEENFMQIFKSQTLESAISMESDKEVKWSATDQDELATDNLRKEIEYTYLFGHKGYIYNTETRRYVYTTAGAFEQIVKNGKVIDMDVDNITENDLIDLEKFIFTGNNGSSSRLLFAGSDFVSSISKIPSINRQIDANSTERKFGYTWRRIVTNFGELYLIMHPAFDEAGYSKWAMVLDEQYVSKRVFRSLGRHVLDLKASGIYDGNSNVLTEISSICLKYGKCHALIVPE